MNAFPDSHKLCKQHLWTPVKLLGEHLTDAILTTAMQEDKHVLGTCTRRRICVSFNVSDATVIWSKEMKREEAIVNM